MTAGHRALSATDGHLDGRDVPVGDAVSLADVALHAYTHMAHEAGFDLGS